MKWLKEHNFLSLAMFCAIGFICALIGLVQGIRTYKIKSILPEPVTTQGVNFEQYPVAGGGIQTIFRFSGDGDITYEVVITELGKRK
jgi:hypothetical protein